MGMGGSGDVEATMPPPQLDLYEPLLEKETERIYVNGNGNANGNGHAANGHHVAMIGMKESPVESLDFE
jgi:hypothetical protein